MARRKPRVVNSPAAVADILNLADYLAEHASERVAARFGRAAQQTINRLAAMPGLGKRWDSEHPQLSEMRYFPIGKFKNHLVFYLPLGGGGIAVLRVLHGAQDIDALFHTEE